MKLFRRCGMFPHRFELVYDNYNALVFGISPNWAETSDAFISMAVYPKWSRSSSSTAPTYATRTVYSLVKASKSGVRLTKPQKTINTPEAEVIITQPVLPYESAFLAAPTLSTIVKSVSAKQQPRRPRKWRPPAAARSLYPSLGAEQLGRPARLSPITNDCVRVFVVLHVCFQNAL